MAYCSANSNSDYCALASKDTSGDEINLAIYATTGGPVWNHMIRRILPERGISAQVLGRFGPTKASRGDLRDDKLFRKPLSLHLWGCRYIAVP